MRTRVSGLVLLALVLLAVGAARGDCLIFLDCTDGLSGQCGIGGYQNIACYDTSECATVDCSDGDCFSSAYCEWYCTNGRPKIIPYSCSPQQVGPQTAASQPASCLAPALASAASFQTPMRASATGRDASLLQGFDFSGSPRPGHGLHAAAPGAQAGPEVDVDVEIPPQFGLALEDISLTASPAGLKSGSFSVRNERDSSLLAYQLSWTFYSGDRVVGAQFPMEDAWIDGGVPAGGTSQFWVSGFAGVPVLPVTKAVVAALYAEYADGTRLGPKSSSLFATLTASRRTTVATYGRLLDLYNQAGVEGLMKGLAQDHKSKAPQDRGAAFVLSRMLKDKGPDAVAAELRRVSRLSLPQ